MKKIIKAGLTTGVAACLTLALTLQGQSMRLRRLLPEEVAKPYYVALRTDLPAGARVEIRDADGTPVDTVAVTEGDCVLELTPGSYEAAAGENTLRFTVRANASVAQVSGDGWGDGEVLHMTADKVGSLTIFRTEGSGSYRYTLSGDGGDFAGVIDYGAGRSDIWRSTRLDGLPAGKYRLYENGRLVQIVQVAPGNNSTRLD